MTPKSQISLREHFPLFTQSPDLAYFDSAATSQKPKQVIEKMAEFYSYENANVHRGIYALSEKATSLYEGARLKIAQFLGVKDEGEILFTSGTTAGLNLVARSWGESQLKPGDEILLPISEHHSNIVCWHQVSQKTGAVVRFIPLKADFRLDMQAAKKLVSPRTKILAFAHISNVLGMIHPVRELVALAQSVGAITVCDGAQSIVHLPISVKDLGVDFYAFSGHKMCGPTGIGVLYGKRELLEAMPPFLGGGDMIRTVTTEGFTCADLPSKFEAGTPPFAQAVGLGEAVDFLQSLDREAVLKHERTLGIQIWEHLQKKPGVKTFCIPDENWVGIVAFHHAKCHPHDLAAILDTHGVCIRAGHHCTQPLMNFLGVTATARLSPFMYNHQQDVDRFFEALDKAEKLLA